MDAMSDPPTRPEEQRPWGNPANRKYLVAVHFFDRDKAEVPSSVYKVVYRDWASAPRVDDLLDLTPNTAHPVGGVIYHEDMVTLHIAECGQEFFTELVEHGYTSDKQEALTGWV